MHYIHIDSSDSYYNIHDVDRRHIFWVLLGLMRYKIILIKWAFVSFKIPVLHADWQIFARWQNPLATVRLLRKRLICFMFMNKSPNFIPHLNISTAVQWQKENISFLKLNSLCLNLNRYIAQTFLFRCNHSRVDPKNF